MKQLILSLMALGLVAVYLSCEREQALTPTMQDEDLIVQITTAPGIVQTGVAQVPAGIHEWVRDNHAPWAPEMIFTAPDLGYEVLLENGLCIFFDVHGRHLDHDGLHSDFDNPHGWGMVETFCLAGDTLSPGSLPQAVVSYVAGHYPGSAITLAVLKPGGKIGVQLDADVILLFDPAGEFLHVCSALSGGVFTHAHQHDMPWGLPQCDSMLYQGNGPGNPHGGMGGPHGNPPGEAGPCGGGSWIQAGELPAVIVNYIMTHYPEATVVHAIQAYNGNYFLRLSDCTRLLFDPEGNLLFDSGA